MEKVLKKALKKRLAKLCGQAIAEAMAMESLGQLEASAAMRAHAERLGNVLESYDRAPQAPAAPAKATWGAPKKED